MEKNKKDKKKLVISVTDTAKMKKKLGAGDLTKILGGRHLPTPND